MSPAVTPDQVLQMRKLRAEGLTGQQLAERFNLSPSGVYFHTSPQPPRKSQAKRHTVSPEEHDTIVRLRAAGVSVAEIARQLGVNESTVSKHSPREPKPNPPTQDECLLAAYPWAVRLTVTERAEFSHELSRPRKYMQEAEIDRLVLRWRHKAERRKP